MKAVILAAGIASRLRPLTDNTPKCLLDIGNKNLLSLTLENLISNDVDDIIMVTGYLENQIKDYLAIHFPQLAVQFIYNAVYDSTNNIYSLWLTKDVIQGHDMLLLDSDILFDKEIIARLIQSGHENCLALKKHAVQDEEIKIKVDENLRILEIGKTVKPELAIGESIGIEKFHASFVEKLFEHLDYKMRVEKSVNLFYEAAFQELIQWGENVYAVDVSDLNCMEIDTPLDLETASRLMIKSTS